MSALLFILRNDEMIPFIQKEQCVHEWILGE